MKPRKSDFLSPKNKKYHDKITLPKKDNMSIVVGWTVVTYFTSAILILSNYSFYVLKIIHLVQLFCFFLAISFLIPIRLYRKKLNMSYYEYVFINFLGVTPLILMLVLGLNTAFKSEPYVETYRIANSSSSNGSMTFVLENNEYEQYEHVRSIDLSKGVIIEGNTYLSIHFTDGLLGIRMIEQHHVH